MTGSDEGALRHRVAIFPAGDRFEDFYDKIGVSLEDFRDQLKGGWLFNYVDALSSAGVTTVLFFSSARVSGPVRFSHADTGADVCVLPVPRLRHKILRARERFRSESDALLSIASYVSTPLRAVTREVRAYGCGALLCQEYEYARFEACVLLGRRLGLPVFATYQGSDSPASQLETPFRRLALRGCSGLLIGARAEIDRIETHYRVPESKVCYIPNAVDVGLWRPGDRDAARRRVGLPGDRCIVAWHGRVQIERKGLDILLDAWERIYERGCDSKPLLLLIGSGRDASRLETMISSSVASDAVLWIDRYVQDPELLRSYLVAAEAFVLPSRHEGFAVSLIEAMACGLPVVATDVSGVRDALGKGDSSAGRIVARGDAAGLATGLETILGDGRLRDELGVRARRRAEREFSIEAVGERMKKFMSARGAFRGR